MKEFKLPHLPSDPEENNKDLVSDFWLGVKKKKIVQQDIDLKLKMKNIVIFGAPGSGKGTE